MKEESNKYQIYKNINPSSILDYVGGGHLPKNNTQAINPHILNFASKRGSIYTQKKFDSKGTSPKVKTLNTIFERIKKNEESSSPDSNDSEDNNSIKSHKNALKQFKSVNMNYKLSNTNISSQIYGSTNKIYNYKLNKKMFKKNYYANISWANDNNPEKYNTFISDIYSSKDMSRSFKSSIDEDKSEFFLNKKESDEENEEEEDEKDQKKDSITKKHIDFCKKRKEIKKIFYQIISIFYFSLYLLSLKISLKLSMPEIPALGASSFIISFNNIFISLIFMKLDQVSIKEYLYIDKIGNYFFKIVFNYVRILLTIKSLQKIKLFTFILILNMNPLLVSYASIIENNRSFKSSDFFYYFIFLFIIIIEFIAHNKVSIISLITLMIINTFITFTKITVIKNIHSYIIDFGSSLIGIAISPILMSLNEDCFNISFSQYILFTIISFTYFLNHYFESKYAYYFLGQGYQICSHAIIVCLYILYSNFLLREDNTLKSYIILIFSFIVNIYGKFRIEASGV